MKIQFSIYCVIYKSILMKRLFIFDVDGVLLDLWTSMRPAFANYHGMSLSDEDWNNIIDDFLHNSEPYMEFCDYFHQSQTFRSLLPIKGMPELVFELRNRCFDLVVISSCDADLAEPRHKNLEEHYANCFEKVVCVGMRLPKKNALRQVAAGYDEVFFLDDNPRHLSDSLGIVTCPIWKENRHHLFLWQSIDHSGIQKAQSVKDILNIVLDKS